MIRIRRPVWFYATPPINHTLFTRIAPQMQMSRPLNWVYIKYRRADHLTTEVYNSFAQQTRPARGKEEHRDRNREVLPLSDDIDHDPLSFRREAVQRSMVSAGVVKQSVVLSVIEVASDSRR
jgi:hypothetical protein